MKKAKGFIVKWTTGERFYVHVQHLNSNITDSNRYESRSGRNKKVAKLKKQFPGYAALNKKELKALKNK
jgi:hypothetical protein